MIYEIDIRTELSTRLMNLVDGFHMEDLFYDSFTRRYGKIENDYDTLRTVVELTEGRPISSKTKLDFLQGKINEYIQSNPRKFLNTIQDELLPAKVLIRKCLDAGLIGKKNDAYYLTSDGSPLCEMNETSTLNNAAKYISSVKRQELKYTLEAKLKDKA